jgi:photosystem II stability/assembly factor-like uncharacterized protein
MSKPQSRILSVILSMLAIRCAAQEPPAVATESAEPPTAVASSWSNASTPSQAVNVIAVGDVFWICGANEMVASSTDGGSSWTLQHQTPGGATLLNIDFVTNEIGFAGGTGGQLLFTVDGGKSWKAHNAGEDVQAFSFADAHNGIAVIGGDRNAEVGLSGQPIVMDGTVKLTHDGGDHWEDIAALSSEELKPFTQVLAVAALDASDYLMIRRQPRIEDVFVVSHDAGKSWRMVRPRSDDTNRELPRWVFVHDGEYWAFGMELVHRDEHGGYGVPLTLHSKDGETWIHGTSGNKEFGGCNHQGCFMWDGTVEALYEEQPQYWDLPQDGTMSNIWAFTRHRACTVGKLVECGPVAMTEEPQPRPSPKPVEIANDSPKGAFRLGLPDDCVQCGLSPIPWNIQQRSVLFFNATFRIGSAGDVKEVTLNQQLETLQTPITQQLSQWRFKPLTDSADRQKSLRLVVKCGFDNSVCEIVTMVANQ